jgi:hypothetical protein
VFHPERDQVAHYYRFQELKLGDGIAGETPHDPGPPVIRSRLTGTLFTPCVPIRGPLTILRTVRFT